MTFKRHCETYLVSLAIKYISGLHPRMANVPYRLFVEANNNYSVTLTLPPTVKKLFPHLNITKICLHNETTGVTKYTYTGRSKVIQMQLAANALNSGKIIMSQEVNSFTHFLKGVYATHIEKGSDMLLKSDGGHVVYLNDTSLPYELQDVVQRPAAEVDTMSDTLQNQMVNVKEGKTISGKGRSKGQYIQDDLITIILLMTGTFLFYDIQNATQLLHIPVV